MNLKQCCRVWAISDALAGHRRQAQALAAALAQGPYQTYEIAFKRPWSWLSPRLALGAERGLRQSLGAAWHSPPDVAVGCGRQAALATRLLRHRGTRVVQILSPRVRQRYWDILVVPEHDQIVADHIVPSIASLHPIDDAWLARERAHFSTLGTLPQPRVALLFGGPTRQVSWSLAHLDELIAALTVFLAQQQGSLLIVGSRRTPQEWQRHVAATMQEFIGLNWMWGQADPNPFGGVLAWADLIVATSDSANLLTEACATRTPVVAAFAQQATGRFARLLRRLMAMRRVVISLPAWPVTAVQQPLRETPLIAKKIMTLLTQY